MHSFLGDPHAVLPEAKHHAISLGDDIAILIVVTAAPVHDQIDLNKMQTQKQKPIVVIHVHSYQLH